MNLDQGLKRFGVAFPKIKELSPQVDDVMEGAEETLSEHEFAGCDTSWARAHLLKAE
jgi:hypothetical protein